MKIIKYPDGSSYVTTTNGDGKSDHKITFKINNYEDLWCLKPLMKLCDKIGWQGETISASKARTEDGMKPILPEFTGGKDIIIIDDICVYGGTFKGLSKLIRETGFEGKLYLAVSHMTVQNLGEDPVTNYFDKVFTTNSKFDKYCYGEKHESFENKDYLGIPQNLEIIKLF